MEDWWFEVGRILDCQNDDDFYKLREGEENSFPKGMTKAQENLFERNLWRLYQAIWKDSAISYYVERDQDYDRVLDIFVRANEAGTELSKPEIIVSMLESKWKKGAKDRLDKLTDQVNNRLPKPNNINVEFIMRACLVLANLPVRYRINTFTTKNIDLVETIWPGIHKAIVRTFTLINRFGIDRNNLTSLNIMIPLILFIYRNPEVTFLGSTPFEVRNAGLMRRWLILAMLNRVGARGVDQVLANLRGVILKYPRGKDFPVNALNAELERMRFRTNFDETAIRSYLDSEYPVAFLQLSLLYDDHFWDAATTQQDHIFPQALFTKENKEFAALSPRKMERYLELCNRAANLELLIDRENNEKRAKPFKQWLETRDKDFRKRHLIPKDDALLSFNRFEEFIAEREKLIIKKLQEVI